MEIKHEIIENTGRFYIEEESINLAQLDYQLPDKSTLLITHTEVNDSLAGKGIGKELVGAAVHYARDKSFVVKATCSFARAILDSSADFGDVYNDENKANA